MSNPGTERNFAPSQDSTWFRWRNSATSHSVSCVVFDNVSLSLGGKTILDELSLRIDESDRIGLIGPNGSGKSTLMRLVSGDQEPDSGRITCRRNQRVGYLAQDVAVEGGKTLLELVLSGVPERDTIQSRIEVIEKELGAGTCSDDEMMRLAEELGDLHERIMAFDADYSEHRAHSILTGLGFKQGDASRDIGEFSGGWKMRGVLASLLFQQPDLLLLDEPTNHLDMPSVAWLSRFLKTYRRAFILISHDREFLNEQIARVVSYEMEGVRTYKGNYDQYLRQREEEAVLLEARSKNVEKEKEHLRQFIGRFRAKASKAAQVQSRIKQLAKLEEVEVYKPRQVMRFRFPTCGRSGRQPIETKSLSKSYDELEVLRDVSVTVERGDRIAFIGANGAGKTTLLRMLAGELEPSAGEVEYGHQAKLGYYAQHHADALNMTSTVYDEVEQSAEKLTNQQVRTALGALLFSDDEVDKKVGVLSGGERARVALAKLLVDPGNVLIMDEPTNHLDLDSSERLGDALDTFDGTLIFVSHNRGFIRRLAKKIWFVQDGKVEEYPGTFDDYLQSDLAAEHREAEAAASKNGSKSASKPAAKPEMKVSKPKETAAEQKERKRREADLRKSLAKKLKPLTKRSNELEGKIAKLEEEQSARSEKLSDPALYDDKAAQKEVSLAFSKAQAELDVAMETWTEIQSEIDAINEEVEANS